jgi:ATP-dependent DNA helicase RecG
MSAEEEGVAQLLLLRLLQLARAAALTMLERHPQAADKHVLRWLGGRADYLKA